jgi:acetoin utilization deacetylase AcuC-like enzyme
MISLFWSPKFVLPLPEGHPFPMIKYQLVRQQLVEQHVVGEESFIEPQPIDIETLRLVHTESYLERLFEGTQTEAEIRRTGFPYSKAMIERERLICAAMVRAAESAFESGISFNMAGGTHHAFADFGSAYCIFNDMAVAASHLLHRDMAQRVMIVDLDVHQGNGTASIFKHQPNVFVFNVHGKSAFPLRKETSDMDIELPDGVTDEQYLEILSENMTVAMDTFQPQIVLYQAGVDLLWCDKLGKLSLTLEGLRMRDCFVFHSCKQRLIPVAVCVGGGYATDIHIIVEAHCNTIKEAIGV